MRLPAHIMVCSLLLVLGGCRFGARPQAYLKAAGPNAELKFQRGVETLGVSRLFSRQVYHELLALNDEGLLILTRGQIVHVEYRALLSYQLKRKTLTFSRKDPASTIQKKILALGHGNLPLLVRFPGGVSPALQESLLQSYGQDKLIVVSRE